MDSLKKAILANLEFLPEKVILYRPSPQLVELKSNYFDSDRQHAYHLTVELFVTTSCEEIIDFKIERIFFFQNEGETPSFSFTKEELTDYIDY